MKYVVGDKFKSFSQHENVMTVSELKEIIQRQKLNYFQNFQMPYMIGQGVSHEDRSLMKKYARKGKIGFIVNGFQHHASCTLTHKRRQENIMITRPRLQSKNQYHAYLVLDENCDEMRDHVTGQHIQGMVLTEAARQMMLAVGESYILDESEKGNSYCALLNINSVFNTFAFPLEIEIEHQVLKHEKPQSGKHIVSTKTNFLQLGNTPAKITIDYIFNNEKILSKTENRLVLKTLEKTKYLAILPTAVNDAI